MTWEELTALLERLGAAHDVKVHTVRHDGMDTVALHFVPVAWFVSMRFTGALNIGVALSLAVSSAAALAGWRRVRRAAARYDDARLGDLLMQVEDAPAWALFPHPVQIIKREHTARCRRRWGVTARTSGWERFRRSWRTEAAAAFGCLVVLMHAWWLGLW